MKRLVDTFSIHDRELLSRCLGSIVRDRVSARAGETSFEFGLAGDTGSLLLAAALEHVGASEQIDAAQVEAWANQTGQALERDPCVSLWHGAAGAVWALEIAGFVDEDLPRGLAELITPALDEVWDGELDLVSGLIGIGVFGLTLPSAVGETFTARVMDQLAETLRRTGAIRVHSGTSLARDRGVEFDVGIAHGIGGLIGLAARVYERFGLPMARQVCEQAVDWLLAQRQPAGAVGRFPAVVDEHGRATASRAAWCYGDPGLSWVLHTAGRALGRSDWLDEALRVASSTAQRRDDGMRVEGPAICHGAAGLAHIFHRWYEATGDTSFADVARHWLRRACDEVHLLAPSSGGLLEGDTGVALVILDVMHEGVPLWDTPLLTSAA